MDEEGRPEGGFNPLHVAGPSWIQHADPLHEVVEAVALHAQCEDVTRPFAFRDGRVEDRANRVLRRCEVRFPQVMVFKPARERGLVKMRVRIACDPGRGKQPAQQSAAASWRGADHIGLESVRLHGACDLIAIGGD